MAKLLTLESGKPAFGTFVAAGATTAGLAQYKIDRLLELRALIDSLRHDPPHSPPGGSDREYAAAR